MRRVCVAIVALAFLTAPGPVQVKSYTKKDGTVVNAHTRSAPGTRVSPPAGPPIAPRLEARGQEPKREQHETEKGHPKEPAARPVLLRLNATIVVRIGSPVPIARSSDLIREWEKATAVRRQKLVADGKVELVDEEVRVEALTESGGVTAIRIAGEDYFAPSSGVQWAAPSDNKEIGASSEGAAKKLGFVTPPENGVVYLGTAKLLLSLTNDRQLRTKWLAEGSLFEVKTETEVEVVKREWDFTQVRLKEKAWLVETKYVREK